MPRDVTTLLAAAAAAARGGNQVSFRKGVVRSWDAAAGTNVIEVGGAEVPDVPTLLSGDSLVLQPGDVVGLLRTHTSYFVVGRVASPGGFAGFVVPVPLTPSFESVRLSGTAGAASTQLRLPASALFGVETQIYEGRLCASSGRVRFDGVWGTLSGSQVITYRCRVGGTLVGTWTTPAVGPLAGPAPELATFNVADRIGQPFVKIELTAQSSVNNGDLVACHLLGAYQ